MQTEDILEKLLNFITYSFMVEKEEIELDKSMIDEGIIDSFGLVEIVTFIEKEYCFDVNEDDLNRDNFGSVLKIVSYVSRQISQ